MANPFSAAGYDDLRAYVQNNWNHIAVLDDTGAEVLRWDVPSNADASWASDATGNPLTAELVITGQTLIDAGYTLPLTLASTEAYKSDSATTAMGADTMTNATMETESDTLTITHDYELPQL